MRHKNVNFQFSNLDSYFLAQVLASVPPPSLPLQPTLKPSAWAPLSENEKYLQHLSCRVTLLFLKWCIWSLQILQKLPSYPSRTLIGPHQAKKCFQACAKSAVSDHPAHTRSTIQAFTLHSYILYYPMIVLADSEGPDETSRMRSLIRAFVVRTI